jgi:hypothetical protein
LAQLIARYVIPRRSMRLPAEDVDVIVTLLNALPQVKMARQAKRWLNWLLGDGIYFIIAMRVADAQSVSTSLYSIRHAANDAQKTMGLSMALLFFARHAGGQGGDGACSRPAAAAMKRFRPGSRARQRL